MTDKQERSLPLTVSTRSCGDEEGQEAETKASTTTPSMAEAGQQEAAPAPAQGATTEDTRVIAPAETKAVFWLKLTVLAVLIASCLTMALAVYFYISNAETADFEQHVLDSVEKVRDAVLRQFDLTLGMADSFVLDLASHAHHVNETWPFVTLPDFAHHLAKLRTLAHVVVVSTYPLVTLADREAWELYAAQHDDWVDQGLQFQASDPRYKGKIMSNYSVNKVIHDNYGPSTGPGPFFPQWQSSPIVPNYAPYNWDGAAYDALAPALTELLYQQRVVLSKVFNFPNLNDPVSITDAQTSMDWIKDYINPADDDPSEPLSDVFYPITMDYSHDEMLDVQQNAAVVGIFSMTFFWREFLENILPLGSEGIILVFDNTCDQTFTYRLDGPDATYLGRGDLHDHKYDYLGSTTDLAEVFNRHTHDNSYTGLPLSGEQCPYSLRVFPSQDTQDSFSTTNPVTFTLMAVLIFAFTSGVFLMYDCCVERRQQKVLQTAVESTANVSLLEDKVRERTRTLQDTNERLQDANRRILAASAAQLQHFACMSHEIRTPLNCIIGLSSLMQEQADLNPVQAESMQMIVSSSDLLLTVVNDVLDYSKLESGNVEIDIQRCNLQETLNSVVLAIETKARSKQVSLNTLYDARVPEFFRTDGRRLQQILFNLLGNAIKFSKEGGVVDLKISLCSTADDVPSSSEKQCSSTGETYSYSPSPAKHVHRKEGQENNSSTVLRFTVKDYGQGIARKDFATIFEPFRQAGAETEAVYGGTGLGLAITAKLVHGLGGSVRVKSEEGKWAEFSVDLPFDETPVDMDALAAGLKNATILLVSDEVDVSDQVSGIFRQFHVDCNTFGDMKELDAWVGGNLLSRERSYICIVQEYLYDGAIYERLSTAAKSVLVICGPINLRNVVEEAVGRYRCLVRVLPSVLVRCMGEHVAAATAPVSCDSARQACPRSSTANVVPYQEFRVLVAEDNAINQKVLLCILNRLGIHHVTIVDNGLKAVEMEAAEPFDVCLTDVQMPVMDGIEACKIMTRRQGGHPVATVVFVTAHASEEFQSACMQAGASDFLTKPFNISDIERCFLKLHAAKTSPETAQSDVVT